VERYVVTRPYETSNIGSNLASLAGAVWLAQRLGRTLVVDWRGLTQLADRSLNYFTEFFEAPGSILGVPVRYAPADGLPPYGQEWLEPAQARALGADPGAAAPDVVALRTYHGPDRIMAASDADRFRLLRSFYRQLSLRPPLAAAVREWADEHLDGAFVVGVNVRTGNGQYFNRGERYASRVDISLFADETRFLRLLERACRRRLRGLPRPLRRAAVVFYATDSAEMSRLLARLPGAVTRRRTFPPPGTGDMYLFEGGAYTDRDSIGDTLVDMFLLARCDALVYNTSLFNQYARVVTGHFGGNEVHLETIGLRRRARLLGAAAERQLRRRVPALAR